MYKVEILRATYKEDIVTVYGSVEDTPIEETCWKSHLDTLKTEEEQSAYLADILAKKYDATLDKIFPVKRQIMIIDLASDESAGKV